MVTASRRRFFHVAIVVLVAATSTFTLPAPVHAQDELIDRVGPPALDEFEVDANTDGVPDGWYNARDAKIIAEGGAARPQFVRFETTKTGREARISRAFGVDGRTTEAVVLGLWVRVKGIQLGERLGQEPSLAIDFLGDQLRALSRGAVGPWTHHVGYRWTHVSKRIPVQPGTKDAILSVGLLGATGILDVDGLSIELIPRGGSESTNLVTNGDFELADPTPLAWITDSHTKRVFPGYNSTSAIELSQPRSQVLSGLAVPVEPFSALDISIAASYSALRGADNAVARLFFIDEFGSPVPGHDSGDLVMNWSGTSRSWRVTKAQVPVPRGAIRAVLQVDKNDAGGWLRIDDIRVTAAPNPAAGAWTPFHTANDTDDWNPVTPSPRITPESALDVSFLLPKPAGSRGFVTTKSGRLTFENGERARFFGVSSLAPAAFIDPARADQFADRLARSGINLVKLSDLDTPLGPERSLYDDTRDDTKAFDTQALAKLDHLIATLESRGIYVALELRSRRRFRAGDGVPAPGLLPDGGGPAAHFDAAISKLTLESARALLAHVNPETGRRLADDPALAWVTIAGESSIFDQIDKPESLQGVHQKSLDNVAKKSLGRAGRIFWESLESAYLKQMADALRKDHVRAPIAGVSHWRREPEFVAAQTGSGLELIDDRLYWNAPSWVAPQFRSALWSLEGGLSAMASSKRKPDRPYVVGQWCSMTSGAWAVPYEGIDQVLAVSTALNDDWDALVRRGVFVYPTVWGEGAVGTAGGEDIFQLAEVINGSPQIYALWPHLASIWFRSRSSRSSSTTPPSTAKSRGRGVQGWDPAHGQLVVDTPFTKGIAGWIAAAPAKLGSFQFSTTNNGVALLATSVSEQPLTDTKRVLVSAVGRVEPTGFQWVNTWKSDVADSGRAPLLQEPISASVVWRKKGTVRAYRLDNTGERIGPAKLEPLPGGEGVTLTIDGRSGGFHWELTAD